MRIAAVLLFLASGSLPATIAQFSDTAIVIRDGRRIIRLPDLIDPHSFHETLHALQKVGDTIYVVYGSSEMSRGWPPRNGNCGAGVESFIRWLKVVAGKIVDRQEGLYESCRKGRSGYSIAWRDHRLTWQTDGWRRSEVATESSLSVHFTWVYDPAHPEKGIVETEKPTEWQPTKK